MNRSVREITEGAMLAALVGVFLLIDRQTAGIVSGFLFMFLPLPLVYYGVKYGFRKSLVLFFVMLILTFMFTTIMDVVFYLNFYAMGLVYGSLVQKLPKNKTIFYTCLASVLITFLSVALIVLIFDVNYIQSTLESTKEMLSSAVLQGQNSALQNQLTTLLNKNFLLYLFIFSQIFSGVMFGILTHLMSKIMFKRLKIQIHQKPQLPIILYYPSIYMGYISLVLMVAGQVVAAKGYDTALMMLIVFVGMLGQMYLVIFGAIGLFLFLLRFHLPKFSLVLLIIFAFIRFSFVLGIFGFLYITTPLHNRLLEGVRYETKNE